MRCLTKQDCFGGFPRVIARITYCTWGDFQPRAIAEKQIGRDLIECILICQLAAV